MIVLFNLAHLYADIGGEFGPLALTKVPQSRGQHLAKGHLVCLWRQISYLDCIRSILAPQDEQIGEVNLGRPAIFLLALSVL